MIAIDQLILHDPDNGKYGDCMRACIASLLELTINEVPHFYESGSAQEYDELLISFLRIRGLAELCVSFGESYNLPDYFGGARGVHHLMCGKSERGVLHAVVGLDGEMVHDPHPTKAGLLKVDHLSFLVRLC